MRGWGKLVAAANAAGRSVFCAASDATPADIQLNSLNIGNFIATRDNWDQRFDFDTTIYETEELARAAWKQFAQDRWTIFKERLPTDHDPLITAVSIENEQRGWLSWKQQNDDGPIEGEIPGFTGWADCEGWQAYYTALEILKEPGYRYFAFAYSGGLPEIGAWSQPGMIEYLKLCQKHPDRLGIALHEYSFNDDLFDTVVWGAVPEDATGSHVFRFQYLHRDCDRLGINYPAIHIKEFGYHERKLSPSIYQTKEQFIKAAEVYAQFPNIEGVAIWTAAVGWSGLGDKVEELIPWLEEMYLTQEWEIEEPKPPEPEEPKHKVVIWKIPQEYTLYDALKIAEEAYGEYRRTVTSSTDDALTMLRSGNEESYVVVWDPDEPSQQEIVVACELNGYKHEYRYLKPKKDLFPNNIQLGFLMKWRYVMTSPFNAKRSYANGLHEGYDINLINGRHNSTEAILCSYPGIVERSLDSTGGYGIYVRVKHTLDEHIFYTRYCHLDQRYVEVGQLVDIGSEIGEIGTTGNVTGQHLHFNLEIPNFGLHGYVVRDVVDPALYLPDPSTLPLYRKPSQKVYDMLKYIRGDGRMFEVRHMSGTTETFQVHQSSATRFELVKNSQYESFRYDNEYIWRGIDTSAGPAPVYAEYPGQNRYYDQFDPGQTMAKWCMRNMAIGQSFIGKGHHVQFYYKDTCQKSAANSGSATNRVTFVAYHKTYEGYNGVVVADVVELKTSTGESMFFAAGFGLVAWESEWGKSKISEIHSGRPDLVKETGCFS